MDVIRKELSSVELFTGAGGMAMGLAKAGFDHTLLVEYNRDACRTLRQNLSLFTDGNNSPILHEGDVRTVDFRQLNGSIDLLAAGAPCQPFSIAGKHRTHLDERNLFPEVFRAQREMLPRAVVIENVRGLLRTSLEPFVKYIELQLAHPEVLPNDPMRAEGWQEHLPKLERAARNTNVHQVRYRVDRFLLQAANFGVPQRRHRVFFVALRQDLGAAPVAPRASHSSDALLVDQWVTGAYWERHGLPRPRSVPAQLTRKVRSLADADSRLFGKPWRTVRDVISNLPEPTLRQEDRTAHYHYVQPGARAYPGHTGSPLDEPSKTLKAGVHGVPGGENMLRHPNGRVRYFTVREAARLQCFPDAYRLAGAWSEAMRQLGNAVPVDLAAAVATEVRRALGVGSHHGITHAA